MCHLLRSALRDGSPPCRAAFRPHVNDPVGPFDDVEIMFHHNHSIPGIDQAL
jgi:hypothetical protein